MDLLNETALLKTKSTLFNLFIRETSQFLCYERLLKGQATVGPTVKSGQWQAPRINGFSELSQVMSRSVTDCKHAGCWNQLIYWNLCTFVVEDDWCKILKICTL